MRSVAEIDAEIAQVERELAECEGTECEVYARIVGYYRSVKNWNKGKREEYKERKMFSQPVCGVSAAELQANETGAGARVETEAAHEV